MKSILLRISLLFMLMATVPAVLPVQAQCPMCRMSAESNLKNGGKAGRGLNAGILYMLSLPYLLVGTIGIWWWRNRRRNNDSGSNQDDDANHPSRVDPAQLN